MWKAILIAACAWLGMALSIETGQSDPLIALLYVLACIFSFISVVCIIARTFVYILTFLFMFLLIMYALSMSGLK